MDIPFSHLALAQVRTAWFLLPQGEGGRRPDEGEHAWPSPLPSGTVTKTFRALLETTI